MHYVEIGLIVFALLFFLTQLFIEYKNRNNLLAEYDFDFISAKLDPIMVASLINPYLSFERPPLEALSRSFYLLVLANYLLSMSLFPLLHLLALPVNALCLHDLVYLTGTTIIVHVFASPFLKHALTYGNLTFSNPLHTAAVNLSATKNLNRGVI